MIEVFPVGLLFLVGLMAILYSSVGHGGASGYLAAMALFGLSPDIMRTTALIMNIGVSSLVLIRVSRMYPMNWKLFCFIAMGSIPAAYIGGSFLLGDNQYRMVVGILLIVAAVQMIKGAGREERVKTYYPVMAIAVGVMIGLVSGLTGVGGGIYLSPLLLWLRWINMRGSIMIAAASILANSLSGLLGALTHSTELPAGFIIMFVISIAGALIGSELSVRRLAPSFLRRLLGIVLSIAGVKFIVS